MSIIFLTYILLYVYIHTVMYKTIYDSNAISQRTLSREKSALRRWRNSA